MKVIISAAVALAILGLAACSSAPIVRTNENEWAIGNAGRDNWRTDESVRMSHEGRAAQLCSGRDGRAQPFGPTSPDGRYHFRCTYPEHSRAEQIDAAKGAWRDCLESAEPAVDDLLSDGHTVAAVLATRCSPEVDDLLALVGKGYRWSMPADALQRVRRDVALDVVLRVRAQNRNPAATPPQVVIPSMGPGFQ